MRATYARFFNQTVLDNAMKAFGLHGIPKQFEAAENFVYECLDKNGKPVVLRLSSQIHKPLDQIIAEIDFVNYLYDCGAQVAKALPSLSNEFVQVIETKDTLFWGVVFEKIEGRHIKSNELDQNFITLWGSQIGKLNRLAKKYEPGKYIRQQWYQQDYYAKPEIYTPNDYQMLASHKNYTEKIRLLPINKENYSLIHTDIHTQNLLWDGKKMIVIDFDDCAYAHFAFDVAMAFWYGAHFDKEKSQPFWNQLMDGYSSENTLSNIDLKNIPLFHLLRFTTIFMALSHQLEETELNQQRKDSLEKIRKIALSGELPFELDYTR